MSSPQAEVPSASETAVQREALRAVLRSKTFSKSPMLCELLEYLCKRHSKTASKPAKEFDVAVDVFKRGSDFDAGSDAIVRVEMFRLRKKLRAYYAAEGAGQPVRIVLQSGKYRPQFLSVQASEPEEAAEPLLLLATPPVTTEMLVLPSALPAAAIAPPGLPLTRWIAWSCATILIAGLAVFGAKKIHGRSPSDMPRGESAFPAPDGGIRILCGANQNGWRDSVGRPWQADRYFTGGSIGTVDAITLSRTRDPQLFSHSRTGEFSYAIPLAPGSYELRLYFAERVEAAENTRTFAVTMNDDATLLSDFDIAADAGTATADSKVFKNIGPASDGRLHLAFTRRIGDPILNAIEITPGHPNTLAPVRLVTRNSDFTDRSGAKWAPDNFYLQGRLINHTVGASGPEDPQLFGQERYGNFSYAIPVAAGRYTVKLRFAETYWGPAGPGGGGEGSRVFDVYCNGTALVRSLDIFRTAGFRSELVKEFPHIEPNAQGKILLSFVPIKNYAIVNAIEVIDEGTDSSGTPIASSAR